MRRIIIAICMMLLTMSISGKTLVVYYSYTGNCQDIVESLTTQIEADVMRIEPADKTQKYEADNYAIGTALLNAIKAAPNDAASYPAIDPVSITDLSAYQNIIIVTPLWWSQMAAIMQTYLFNNGSQLAGKHVGLIVSSHSSGISQVVSDAQRLIPNAIWMGEALWINNNNHSERDSLIENWLNTLEFASDQGGMTDNIYITIDGKTLSARLAGNSAAQALVTELQKGSLTLTLKDNSFEIWGPLGFSLPTSNEQIDAQPGDIVLYNGSNICIFYGSNSYSYTRLGKIDGLSADDLKSFLKAGENNISVVISASDPEEETADEDVISITSAGQTTWCSKYDLDFTNLPDLKAYVATGYDKVKGTIWLTRVKQVPAETGFLLMGDPGDYDIPTIDGVSDAYYKNMFKGTLTGTTIYTTDGDYTNYYLSSGASGVGFYKVTNENGVSIKANRCYLPILTDIPANGADGDAEAIKVSAAKQVPYYTSKNIDFTSLEALGVKAYTATGYNYGTGVIWLTRVKKVPAQTGILVMADKEGEYSVPTTSVQSIYENMFAGSETAQTIYTTETVGDIEYINYYLSNGTSGIGFYKVTKEDGVSMGANRSYLQIPKRDSSAGARGMDGNASFSKMVISDNDDDVIGIPLFTEGGTGIQSSMFNDQSSDVYYNLQGQRVDRPSKGLYIKNGKKVVIK